jgi:hypothetical protein
MAGKYATTTSVPVQRTRQEIETLLSRYGATSTAFINDPTESHVAFMVNGRRVRFTLKLPNKADRAFTHTRRAGSSIERPRSTTAIEASWEQACRSSWRALLLVIKANLEAVEAEILTFEQAFLPFLMLDDGTTVGERVIPEYTAAIEGKPFRPLMELGPAR